MAYAYVGSAITSTETTSVTYSPTPGNALILILNAGSGNGNCYATSITGGGTWTSLFGTLGSSGNTIEDGNSFYDGIYYCLNCPSGITALTINTNVSPGQRGVAIIEYSGLNGGLVNYAETSYATNPGTGANAWTSGNVNVNNVPAALIGVAFGTSSPGFTAGTSPTAFTSRLASTFANGDPMIFEDARITSSGNVAATAGSTLGAQLGMIVGVAFAETSSPTPGPLPQRIWMLP